MGVVTVSKFETFEVELEIRDGADVSAQDVLDALSHQSSEYRVRRVESGDPLEAPEGHDIAWGETNE